MLRSIDKLELHGMRRQVAGELVAACATMWAEDFRARKALSPTQRELVETKKSTSSTRGVLGRVTSLDSDPSDSTLRGCVPCCRPTARPIRDPVAHLSGAFTPPTAGALRFNRAIADWRRYTAASAEIRRDTYSGDLIARLSGEIQDRLLQLLAQNEALHERLNRAGIGMDVPMKGKKSSPRQLAPVTNSRDTRASSATDDTR